MTIPISKKKTNLIRYFYNSNKKKWLVKNAIISAGINHKTSDAIQSFKTTHMFPQMFITLSHKNIRKSNIKNLLSHNWKEIKIKLNNQNIVFKINL